ncbi:MAG TPA: T9SS type A sorting domain-containing protein [Parafilimonas sp.]|nr:T9SS type A sorting domain-containing protein [Parafilimonas sp.]
MKPIIIFFFCLLLVTNAATAQCNNNLKVQSPVSEKPKEAMIASVNCNTLTVKWKGNRDETYKLNAVVKDAATNKTIRTKTITDYTFDGLNYIANIPVVTGTKISWSVQGITAEENRLFYSYPLRGKEYVVPTCPTSLADNTKADNALAVIGEESMQVKIYPNPFQSILNIDFSAANKTQKRISVYDVSGKLLLNRFSDGNTQLDVKQLSAGTYLIKITDGNGKELYSGKIIKQ